MASREDTDLMAWQHTQATHTTSTSSLHCDFLSAATSHGSLPLILHSHCHAHLSIRRNRTSPTSTRGHCCQREATGAACCASNHNSTSSSHNSLSFAWSVARDDHFTEPVDHFICPSIYALRATASGILADNAAAISHAYNGTISQLYCFHSRWQRHMCHNI